MFNLIFITLFVAGWSICGIAPWLALSIATRGHAGLIYLPLTIFAANVGGMAVPVLGLDTGRGMVVSFLVALAAPTALLLARRMSLVDAPGMAAVHGTSPREAREE